MINSKEIPLLIYMLFTLVYSIVGDPNNEIWSGLYFLVNYLIMLSLFKDHKSKIIRQVGISLSISIIVFIVLKFFFKLPIDRIYTLIPFIICLIGIIKLELKR